MNTLNQGQMNALESAAGADDSGPLDRLYTASPW